MTEKQSSGEKPAKALPEKKAKRKMRPGGGKAKGNSFEGQVAKKLSAALAPLNFIRSPGSGARVGGKNFEKFGEMFGEDALKIFVADVVPINEKKEGITFLHSIECKFYKTPDSFTQLVAGTANVFKWFEESVEDAKKTNKNPILIFKWNNTPIFVAVNKRHERCPPALQVKDAPFAMVDVARSRPLSIFLLEDIINDPALWYEKAQ
jgi:hypothetical protein